MPFSVTMPVSSLWSVTSKDGLKHFTSGKAMGFYFTVDDLEDDKLTISARDEEGKLIDVSSMGVVVDDTGISHTGLISGLLTGVAAAGAGLYLIGRKLGKEQHE